MRRWWPLALLTAALIGWSGRVEALELVGVYLDPRIGYSWSTFKSIEIEKSFLSAADEEDPSGPSSPSREVGRKSYHKGSGFDLGAGLGLRILALRLGVAYAWSAIELSEGYHKQYVYSVSVGRAVGAKIEDKGSIETHRVMFEAGYGLPIGRLELLLRTRLGGVFLVTNGIEMGRAHEENSGIAADLGIELAGGFFDFLAVGLEGWFGIHSFTGNYEGLYGVYGGLALGMEFRI